jgi:hypothetical protein
MSVLKNPYFLLPALLFWVNQFLEKILKIFVPYVHSYFDDLLAMPVILGITLQIFRWIYRKKESFVFTKIQILVGTAYISFLFEVLLPQWSDIYIADPWDVLCYGLGAVYFYFLINRPGNSKGHTFVP